MIAVCVFTCFSNKIIGIADSDIAADYIITRNPKDFSESSVKVISPNEFVKLVEEN